MSLLVGSRPARWLVVFMALTVLALSASLVRADPARADVGCSRSWHTIKASAAGKNLTVLPYPDAEMAVYALGRPGQDPWYQWMLFCRDPGWGPNHWAISSNTSAAYWGKYDCENCIPHVSAVSREIYDWDNLFEVKPYDAKFWTIRSVGTGEWIYVGLDGRLYGRFWLGAENLFEMNPRNLLA